MKNVKNNGKTKNFFKISVEKIRKLNDIAPKINNKHINFRNFKGINVDLPNMKSPNDNGIIDGAIWGAEGPTLRKAAQADIGNCWLIAGIDSILLDRNGSDAIKHAFDKSCWPDDSKSRLRYISVYLYPITLYIDKSINGNFQIVSVPKKERKSFVIDSLDKNMGKLLYKQSEVEKAKTKNTEYKGLKYSEKIKY